MSRSAALGYVGLMFGLLGVIVMLGFVNHSVDPYGSGYTPLFFGILCWFAGLVFVLGEVYVASDPRSLEAGGTGRSG